MVDALLHASGLGAYGMLSGILFLLIHRSTFSGSTMFSLTAKTSSLLLVSTSFLCCLFLTIARISFALTFLSKRH